MMDKKQLLESQKECAKMLGMTLEEYTEYLKNAKVNETPKSQQKHNDSFLDLLGVNKNQLKTRRGV